MRPFFDRNNYNPVIGESSDGETAILEVTGKMEAEPVKGEITLIKHGDKWVNSREAWE